jgi:hypothetical protein
MSGRVPQIDVIEVPFEEDEEYFPLEEERNTIIFQYD